MGFLGPADALFNHHATPIRLLVELLPVWLLAAAVWDDGTDATSPQPVTHARIAVALVGGGTPRAFARPADASGMAMPFRICEP
jgi:hypothetical protein